MKLIRQNCQNSLSCKRTLYENAYNLSQLNRATLENNIELIAKCYREKVRERMSSLQERIIACGILLCQL